MNVDGIKLSNGRKLKYVVASGALGFDGKGWPWEWLWVLFGWIQRKLFTTTLKTVTRHPRKGNFRWSRFWQCVTLLPGGAGNKFGLTNEGIDWFVREVCPRLNFAKYDYIASIFGNEEELVYMAQLLNQFPFVAIEVNWSCPNSGQGMEQTKAAIKAMHAVKKVCRHPLIAKLSVAQNYLGIAQGIVGAAEAISLNSVPWEMVYPDRKSPLAWLGDGETGGGVSGKPAQEFNWKAVKELVDQGLLPVIAPSVMEFDDMAKVRELGASAVSFGAIHLPSYGRWWQLWKFWTLFTNPLKPTRFIKQEIAMAA
ncbi:hypothetical protein KW786_03440 [Candidatus Parcubacteria bacterium]|nr:hypothetical protein [Candidatus Parcubacteria bacterium]